MPPTNGAGQGRFALIPMRDYGHKLSGPDRDSWRYNLLMLTIAIAALLARGQEQLIADHGASDWVIAEEGTSPSLRRGASELQTYLSKISGVTLPLVTTKPIGRKAIVVRQSEDLPEEAYAITTSDDGIVISGGGNRGAMYGCYGFLQDVLGCRWFTPKVEEVPKRSRLILGQLNIHGSPAFEYREPWFTEALNTDWDARNRLNGTMLPLSDREGGKITYGRFVHTFAELVPPEEYFKTHPEYFSLVNGKRQDGYAQLCLTNPEVLQIVIAKVKEWVRENPFATIFSVSQNDTYLNCQCENCKAVEKEEGSPSGPLLRFVNKVADAVHRDYPNVLIETLAYQWSEKPPLHERPHVGVRVRLAPINSDFAHAINESKGNAEVYANFLAWSKITHQLYTWEYCTDFGAYLQPFPDLEELPADFRQFHKLGVVGIFEEGDGAPGGGGDMAELKSYLMARLMWDPNLDPKPLVSQFLGAVYGPAAPDIAAWLDALQRGVKSTDVCHIGDPPNASYFSEDLLNAGEKLFDDAEAKVAGDPAELEEVQRARMGLLYLQVTRHDPQDPQRNRWGKTLADDIKRFGVQQTAEGVSYKKFLANIRQAP